MRLEILAVDRIRSAWAQAAVADYLNRLERYGPAARRDVKAARGEGPAGVAEEGERLLRAAAIGPGDRLVALTPGGELLDSEAWAALLGGWRDGGVRRAVFAVGGAGGLAPAVLTAAGLSLSLGRQTISHELAQVVLAEQLYRAWTILRGEPYHK